MLNNKIEMGKQYKTRDGRAARVLAVDVKNDWPVIAAVADEDGSETLEEYKESGAYYDGDNPKSDHDLIEVKPVVRVERWATIVRYNSTGIIYTDLHLTETDATTYVYGSNYTVLARAVPFVWEGEDPC